MSKIYPLKILIAHSNPEEISSLKLFTKRFPDIFDTPKIATDLYDLLHVLSAETFTLTFFDESRFPIGLIDKFSKSRFGIVVFKNKRTLTWSKFFSSQKKGYFSLEPPYEDNGRILVQHLLSSVEENNILVPPSSPEQVYTFFFRDKKYFVKESQIICMTVIDNCLTVFFDHENEVLKIVKTGQIKSFQKVSDHFVLFRCHKGALVNLNFIREIDTREIVMKKKYQGKSLRVPLSIRREPELIQWIRKTDIIVCQTCVHLKKWCVCL